MDITVVEYKGRFYPFTKPAHYTENMFQDRCWYIVKNIDIPFIESFADIWISCKYYENEYTKEIMDAVKGYELNMLKY